LINLLLITNPV